MPGKNRAGSTSKIRPCNTTASVASVASNATNAVVNPTTNACEAFGFWAWFGSFWSLINWFFPVKPLVLTEVPIPPVDAEEIDDANRTRTYRINGEIFNGKMGIDLWQAFCKRFYLKYNNVFMYITAVDITYTDAKTKERITIHFDDLRDVEIVNYEIDGGKGFVIKLLHTNLRDTYIESNDNDFQINVKKIKHTPSCFTGDTTIIVKKGYKSVETKFEDLRIGDLVFTEKGFKQVKYITVSNCNGKIISINIDGKVIKGTPYHPISIKGIWMFMRDIDDAVEIDYTGNVYSIVFEDSIEDSTCTGYQLAPYMFGACLGHGLTTKNTVDHVIGHDFFGNRKQIIASVSELPCDKDGRRFINDVVRNSDNGPICGFN